MGAGIEEAAMDTVGRVAVVTGSGAGIGRAIALRLAAEGAAVVVADIDPVGGCETVRRIETSGAAVFVPTDVAVEEDIREALAVGERSYGGVDIVVNNAGGAPEPYFPDALPEHWGRTVAVNLGGVMLGTHYGIKALRRRGGGAIINVSSRAGVGFLPYESPEYAAAKAGVWRFTASLGFLAAEGIRVNCISPDWVEVEALRAARREMGEEKWARVGPTELVQPEEIAAVACRIIADHRLAGRVMLCPCGGDWGLVPTEEVPRVEPL
jgi:NAD(P)-dependent dehydrogenase (short-subunit alcohol dehydrogenase family)